MIASACLECVHHAGSQEEPNCHDDANVSRTASTKRTTFAPTRMHGLVLPMFVVCSGGGGETLNFPNNLTAQ